ncbi:MAG TPA: EF-hand domain-containing protein [Hyphomicrobiales bacterium]|nr:EF-hand domain-containing protein [Hyphomicrobiales bacterium]
MTTRLALCRSALAALLLAAGPTLADEAPAPPTPETAAPVPDGTASDTAPPEAKPPAEPARPRVYSVHDLDRDGYLGREEYRSFEEYVARWRQTTGRPKNRRFPLPFDVIDVDGDGRISEAEMTEALFHHRGPAHRKHRGGM